MDKIADMLTQLRNAQAVGHIEVVVPHSKFKVELAKLLVDEGYLDAAKVFKVPNSSLKKIAIRLKYFEKKPFISHIRRLSTPGRRLYAGREYLPKVLSGRGLVIVSTSQGLMTSRQARQRDLGGELICEVW